MPEVFSPSVEPTLDTTETSTAKVERLEFGDGYSQRAGPSINTVRRELELEFMGVSQSVADAIRVFLRARKGREAFLYTPPGEASAILWTCARWTVRPVGPAAYQATMTFVEEFDIG